MRLLYAYTCHPRQHVSSQVEAHLWHKGPAGGMQWDFHPQHLDTSTSAVSTTEPPHTPVYILHCTFHRIKIIQETS